MSNLAHRIKRIGHLDMAGGGQVVVQDGFAYVGHMKPPYGTSIIDVRDPKNPKVVSEIRLENDASHTHKVRVAGDLMITNVEMNERHFLRKSEKLPDAYAKLGDDASDAAIAAKIGVTAGDIPRLKRHLETGYHDGGFRLWDISDKANPKLLHHERTHGFGVHRFDMDERYAYISTEMEGFLGNILVVYDIADPAKPTEVSRWWMPGQHVAAGEKPFWQGYKNRLHHAMRERDELWAAVWNAGIRVLDVSDISQPKVIGEHDYHPPAPEPTHTVMPVRQPIGDRRIAVAVDEEHEHVRGQPHGGLWIFDVSDIGNFKPLSTFHVSDLDSPWARTGIKGIRFGAHQFQEHLDTTLVYCAWFAGGVRIVDLKDPALPEEVGFFIPEPVSGQPAPQTNDIDVGPDGLIYTIDRLNGFDIIAFEGT